MDLRMINTNGDAGMPSELSRDTASSFDVSNSKLRVMMCTFFADIQIDANVKISPFRRKQPSLRKMLLKGRAEERRRRMSGSIGNQYQMAGLGGATVQCGERPEEKSTNRPYESFGRSLHRNRIEAGTAAPYTT